MSYTLNLDPALVHDAESCALRNGTTLDAMVRACLLVIVSRGVMNGEVQSSVVDKVHQRRRLRIGSMKDEIVLPSNFDTDFDNLDGQVANLFEGVSV